MEGEWRMINLVLLCGVIIIVPILVVILLNWRDSLDKCISCYTRIWPWQRGGAIYNSSWHKKCELASSKGSDSTGKYWRSKMTEHRLMPPDEVFRCVKFEPYDQYLKRMDGIKEYLCKTWGLADNGDEPPEWSVDAEFCEPIMAPKGHRLLVVDGMLVTKKDRDYNLAMTELQ